MLLQGFHGSERRGSPFPCLLGAGHVFQVMVGVDGKPLADVLHDERAPMDALHRRPETTCSNARQCIRSIRTQRKTGRGRTGHGTGPARGSGPDDSWERPSAPSFLTDRRDDMGVASFRNAACRKGRGKGIPASYGGGGRRSGGRRPLAPFCWIGYNVLDSPMGDE